MEILIGWAVLAFVPAAVASGRGRNPGAWFVLALLISPLLALILVVALPNQSSAAASSPSPPAWRESVERSAHAFGSELPVVPTYQDAEGVRIECATPKLFSNGDVELDMYNTDSTTYPGVEMEVSIWGVPERGLRPVLVRKAGMGSLLVFDRPGPYMVAAKTIVLPKLRPGRSHYKTKIPAKLPPNPIGVAVVRRIRRANGWEVGNPP